MMADTEVYEASDEASEGEFDRSLSLWKGWSSVDQTDGEDFKPIPIDLYTAASLGQYDTVRSLIKNWYVHSPFDIKASYRQRHRFSYRLKMGSVQSYGAVST